jgi:hypothetical protein
MEGAVLDLSATGSLAPAIAGALILLVVAIAGFWLSARADRKRAAGSRAEPARKAA